MRGITLTQAASFSSTRSLARRSASCSVEHVLRITILSVIGISPEDREMLTLSSRLVVYESFPRPICVLDRLPAGGWLWLRDPTRSQGCACPDREAGSNQGNRKAERGTRSRNRAQARAHS